MSRFEPECLWPLAAELGEGPIWLDDHLWFVDIKGQAIHRCDAQGGQRQSWPTPQPIGFVQPLEDGALIAGLKDGLYRFRAGRFTPVLHPERGLPANRLNDACTSPDGHLWFGSMDDGEALPTGALYRVAANGDAHCQDSGYVISNGPCFSPDGRRFYHTDTLRQVVYAFDVASDGSLQHRREFARIANGYPDGSTVDAAGYLWVCLFAGGRIERYAPDGRLVQTVALPCPNITKLTFGGPDLCTAYVTTAWKGMTAAQRNAQPLAGGLFCFRTDTPGQTQALITQGFDT